MIHTKISAAIRILRPELALSAGVCVVAGQVLTLGRLPAWQLALAGFICGFALSASALVLNDLFDLEVDKVNQPDRPLPSGAITPAEVIGLDVLVSLAGLAAAASISMSALAIAVVFWLIGIAYNWRGKQTGLPGNLMVSASVAVT